jgi:hypothetical protein
LNKNNGILSSGKKKKEEVVQNLVQTILHAELGARLHFVMPATPIMVGSTMKLRITSLQIAAMR